MNARRQKIPQGKVAEIWRRIRGEMVGNLRKLGERSKRIPPSIHAALLMFSGGSESGSPEISRLPDSATLAPLRMVELITRQGRLGADVSPLRLAVEQLTLGSVIYQSVFLSVEDPVRLVA